MVVPAIIGAIGAATAKGIGMAGAGMAGGVESYLLVNAIKRDPPPTVSHAFIAEASQLDSGFLVNINLRGGIVTVVVITVILIGLYFVNRTGQWCCPSNIACKLKLQRETLKVLLLQKKVCQ